MVRFPTFCTAVLPNLLTSSSKPGSRARKHEFQKPSSGVCTLLVPVCVYITPTRLCRVIHLSVSSRSRKSTTTSVHLNLENIISDSKRSFFSVPTMYWKVCGCGNHKFWLQITMDSQSTCATLRRRTVFDASLGKPIVNRNELTASNMHMLLHVIEQVRIKILQPAPFSSKQVPGQFSSIVPILSVFY